MIKASMNRIRSDYFLPNRIGEYKEIIRTALNEGYEIVSHSKFFQMVMNEELYDRKLLMIRHDIDTDPKYCKEWLKVEGEFGIQTSYFFRLSTARKEIMKAVIRQGSDCGYHFEELATYAKRNRIKNTHEIQHSKHIEAIRYEFLNNLRNLENQIGYKIEYIASHGDFANRKLGLANHIIVDDKLKQDAGIIFETYQKEFLDNYSINISDSGYPLFFRGDMHPLDAFKEHKIVHLLVHPRHWRSSFYWNTYENLKRLVEGFRY